MISDTEIIKAMEEGNILIDPFRRDLLGPNSYDLSLSANHKQIEMINDVRLDTTKRIPRSFDVFGELIRIPGNTTIIVMSNEKVTVKNPYCGIISPRSGFSRLPITISYSHLVDTGYSGVIGANITNHTSYEIILHDRQRFMQIMFHRLTSSVSQNYMEKSNSKYKNNDGLSVPEYKIDKEWLKNANEL